MAYTHAAPAPAPYDEATAFATFTTLNNVEMDAAFATFTTLNNVDLEMDAAFTTFTTLNDVEMDATFATFTTLNDVDSEMDAAFTRLRPSTTSRWVHKHLEPFHSRIAVVPVCKPYLGVSPAMHYCLYTKDGELTTGPVNFVAVSFIYTSKCLNNLMLEPSFRLTPPATAQPSSNSDTRKPTAFRYPHFLALTPSVLSNWADGDQQYRGLE